MSSSLRLLPYKTALITGGTTGIGRAIALGYVSHGARVAVNHLDNTAGHEQFASMVEEARALIGIEGEGEDVLLSVPGDVSNQADAESMVTRTVEKWGRLDVFVSNAGICEFADFLT